MCVRWSLSLAGPKDIWWNRFLQGRGVCLCVCEPEHMAKRRPSSECIRMRVDSLCFSPSQRYSTRSTQSRHDLSQRWETNSPAPRYSWWKIQSSGHVANDSASYAMVNLECSGHDDITAEVSSHPATGCGVNQCQIVLEGERTNTLPFQLYMLWQNHFHGEISPNSSPGQQFPDN